MWLLQSQPNLATLPRLHALNNLERRLLILFGGHQCILVFCAEQADFAGSVGGCATHELLWDGLLLDSQFRVRAVILDFIEGVLQRLQSVVANGVVVDVCVEVVDRLEEEFDALADIPYLNTRIQQPLLLQRRNVVQYLLILQPILNFIVFGFFLSPPRAAFVVFF